MKGNIINMRIISGKARGTKLYTLDGTATRPTLDRVKESLFNIIQNDIEDSTVLDLFSGSGNLGIEALSEGASYAYLVDKNIKCIKTINKNINNIGIENVKVLNMDYKLALKQINKKLDLIFLDPPYKTSLIEDSLKLIDEYDLLSDDGLIVCESDDVDKIIYSNKYESIKEKRYGDKYIVLLKKV